MLLSDGQSNTGTPPLKAAEQAVAAGIKVNTIGIGTPEGGIVRVQGQRVFTKLDEPTLQGIADATGGKYLNAQSEKDLSKIYTDLARERQTQPEDRDLTYYLTGIGLLFSLVAGGFSLADVVQPTAVVLIGVVSDTHGYFDARLGPALAGVEWILHAGDVGSLEVLDRLREMAPWWPVRGNNDDKLGGLGCR